MLLYSFAETKAILLADKFFFLQEKDQRLSLLSIDSKVPVILLKNLMVREVATGELQLELPYIILNITCFYSNWKFIKNIESYVRNSLKF